MIPPPLPPNEESRLAALRSLELLDTGPEERFDHVTRLAQRLFNVPIALVTLVDGDRVWLKSHQGIDGGESSRESSFCGHAILNSEIMNVPDAAADSRFRDNPYVLGDPEIRFYAGCPIAGPTGHLLGTLCLVDSKPREMTARDEANLRDLADIIEQEIASQHLATVDNLTGLSNRRGFELLGAKFLQSFHRRVVPATLLFVDLDDFKSVNDRYGHVVGDHALREFARILETEFRESDVVGRLGGDEFVVLLGDTGDGASGVERIHRALQDRNRTSSEPYQLAASVGTALYDPNDGDTLEHLMRRADDAMYAVKRRP